MNVQVEFVKKIRWSSLLNKWPGNKDPYGLKNTSQHVHTDPLTTLFGFQLEVTAVQLAAQSPALDKQAALRAGAAT